MAMMNHPNIADVYGAGVTTQEQEKRLYFAMEYVPGIPITEYADREELSLEERLRLFVKVCEAIEHANIKQVLHRDITPSNLLAFTRRKQTTSGVERHRDVKVIDFGIAKVLGGRRLSDYYIPGQDVLGKPEYMSPEQTRVTADIDRRADVYSLGAVLYELLSGVQPFDFADKTKDEQLELVRSSKRPSPSTRLTELNPERAKEVAKKNASCSSSSSDAALPASWNGCRSRRCTRTENQTVPVGESTCRRHRELPERAAARRRAG